MKGLKLRKIVAMMALALLAAGVLVALIRKQNAYINQSRETAKLNKGIEGLRGEVALLEMAVGELRRPERIERLAKERFGLEYGSAPVLVYPEGGASRERTAAADGGSEETETSLQARAAWPTKGL